MIASAADGPPSPPPGKIICLFSDGTGNSSAKLSKTNVWRLYQALDLSPPEPGMPQQIAFYDDGVGSGGGKLLMLLGGVFGYGLKRNVLDLYGFVCRNYVPGDQIVAFGFSRGAFTIRLLIGLITSIGLAPYRGETSIDNYSAEMYRRYRKGARMQSWTVSNAFVGVYSAWMRMLMRFKGLDPGIRPEPVGKNVVRFVGVWDTVAAYGTPLAELTRAVDRWICPLSLKNYALSTKVCEACHALSLDDERDTFHPLLWDEVEEDLAVQQGMVKAGRLRQVWFAGVHSDVGGGYPDNSLSLVSLDWMMTNATGAGLRFRDGERERAKSEMNAFGPMHDSRRGLGSYYRYQPRRLSARMHSPSPSSLLMQDPERHLASGRLLQVVVHHSVIQRIHHGPDGYAPITLPSQGFEVESATQTEGGISGAPVSAITCLAAFPSGTSQVWNLVWRKRVAYFVSIVLTLLLVLMPIHDDPSDCAGPICLVSPVLSAGEALTPGFLRPWVQAWSNNPTMFVLLLVGAFCSLRKSKALQRRIDDRMSAIWTAAQTGATVPPSGWVDQMIETLRENFLYQRSLQYLKWRIAPAAFGFLLMYLLILIAVTAAHRLPPLLLWRNVNASYCHSTESTSVGLEPVNAQRIFETWDPCWATGMRVERGAQYRLSLAVEEPWKDGARDRRNPHSPAAHGIPTDPTGFTNAELGWWAFFGAPLKRFLSAPWFQPALTIRDKDGHFHSFPVKVLDDTPGAASAGQTYSGTFESPTDGEAFLFVNDAVLIWYLPAKHDAPLHYANNSGTAKISMTRLPYSAFRAGP